jgi:hypothetical protein
MAKDVQSLIAVRPAFHVKRGNVKCETGLSTRYVASAIFDTAAKDSSGASNKTIAAHGLGVFLPNKAIITKFWYDVTTTFTSATDAGTIAYHAQAANDLLAAIAISDATNVHDAGIRAGKVGFPALGADAAHDTQVEVAALFAATMIKLTAEREITATVAVEALTAGKATLYVEYMIGA